MYLYSYFTLSNILSFYYTIVVISKSKKFESLSVNYPTVGDNNIEIVLYYDVTVYLLFTTHNILLWNH